MVNLFKVTPNRYLLVENDPWQPRETTGILIEVKCLNNIEA